MNLKPRIVSVGTSVPSNFLAQEDIANQYPVNDKRTRSIFLNGGIDRRALAIPDPNSGATYGQEDQAELSERHFSTGMELGKKAIEECLQGIGAGPADVGYLCCVTTTGFISPGLSAHIIKELGISRHCARLDVVGMGCNGGLNALRAVADWSANNPGSLAVMLCVEVCSAMYVIDDKLETAVVNSLFGDGAAAVALATGDDRPGPLVLSFSSLLVHEAIDAMRVIWSKEHAKYRFALDPRIPYVLGEHAPAACRKLLGLSQLMQQDISHWVVHSGGKKVIDALRIGLGLSRHDLRHTLSVLADHGNLSSSSFLFSLERLHAEECCEAGEYGVLMTMGPGSTIEMALVQW